MYRAILGILAGALVVGALLIAFRILRRRKRAATPPNACPECGFQMVSASFPRCPRCGENI